MSPRVLLRWALAGQRGQRLRTLRIGRRHVVTVGELRRFLAAIAPAVAPNPRPSSAAALRLRARRAALARRAAEKALR